MKKTLFFLVIFFTSLPSLAVHSEDAALLSSGVTAHRGDSGVFPENTLAAFQSGIEIGADWIELDLFRTQDGKLVVIHDRTTERVGDRMLDVADSTYSQLLTVDVATDFRKRQRQSARQCPPQRIPLLEEVLRLVMSQERTRVSIQPKMDCVDEAVSLVKRLNAERWVGFNDGNLQWMIQVKRLAPELPVFWDRPADSDIDADIRTATKRGFQALVLEHNGITAAKVQKIHTAGLESGAWTVNDPDPMIAMLEMGVRRIYTDFPGRLMKLKWMRRGRRVTCEGTYPHHLQGVCIDDRAVYWSFTTTLVKTDFDGRLQNKIPVENHHGDLCCHDGKIYVAVNLGRFNDPNGNADSWVYIYDSATLAEVARHEVPQVYHGAGGIGFREGHFYVVGGLPDAVPENDVYEYDDQFSFVKKHVIQSGHTHLGIQTATFADQRWWFGCYGSPSILLVTDDRFEMKGRHEFNAALGIEGLSQGRLLSAGGRCESGKGCTGYIQTAIPDDMSGLQYLEKGSRRKR